MSNTLIECVGVYKSYDQANERLDVINDLNFLINKGESIGLVGSSGCGKSTLLHLLAGLDLPDSGKIRFNGNNIVKFSKDERATFRNKEVGFVYQFHHLLPDFTALENVALPSILSGEDKQYSLNEAREVLDKIGLKDKINSKPNQLSGGERQRVAIARSIINKPSAIIMDEPTGNLDKKNVENLMSLIIDLGKEQQISLIIATHDSNVSSRLDRLLNLE
ncbi:MAG TPA: ABC transporter ATP-binding protein [SAR86 cluster bacterium]|nr:ABC transporter ATP-binding protein [SAR86 cluster bacterium]|tara:strand:- start:13750 stop:14409 length:660 start_codon:yes stop_codon:yes gene_type:complete